MVAAHGALHVGALGVLELFITEPLTRSEILVLSILEDFTQSFQALFAVFIQIFDEALLLDDLGHVLSECHAGPRVLC